VGLRMLFAETVAMLLSTVLFAPVVNLITILV
jgi:hypothetical protein